MTKATTRIAAEARREMRDVWSCWQHHAVATSCCCRSLRCCGVGCCVVGCWFGRAHSTKCLKQHPRSIHCAGLNVQLDGVRQRPRVAKNPMPSHLRVKLPATQLLATEGSKNPLKAETQHFKPASKSSMNSVHELN